MKVDSDAMVAYAEAEFERMFEWVRLAAGNPPPDIEVRVTRRELKKIMKHVYLIGFLEGCLKLHRFLPVIMWNGFRRRQQEAQP